MTATICSLEENISNNVIRNWIGLISLFVLGNYPYTAVFGNWDQKDFLLYMYMRTITEHMYSNIHAFSYDEFVSYTVQ